VVDGSWEAGQHTSSITVSSHFTDDFGVVDVLKVSDPVHYFGVITGLDVEKNISPDGIQWFDADDEQNALERSPGAEIWWRITVTNTSNTTLSITLVDQHDLDTIDLSVVCNPPPPPTLLPIEYYHCIYNGNANTLPGTHHNLLRGEGYFNSELVGVETDPAFYVITKTKVFLPVVLR
jgi:hypothetical protein